jgi:hypothetical protein
MSWAFAFFGEIKDKFYWLKYFWLGLQFAYLWVDYKYKWISRRTGQDQERAFDFKRSQLDVKDIKCLLQWWQKHEVIFPIVGFLVRQILGIVGTQI